MRNLISEYRQSKGLAQFHLVELVGFAQRDVSMFKKGTERKFPRISSSHNARYKNGDILGDILFDSIW